MKHHPLASDDEVWRLENIAKGGISHQNLSDAGIYKVEDILLQLFTDPKKLREHGVVFNTDGQPIGLVKDREYFATPRLSAREKELGDAIVKKALANWNDVREFSGETFSDSMRNNSSSSFSSQVSGGQTENLDHVQRYLAPPDFAAPVGPVASQANVSSTAEGLNAMALALPVQPQNTNSGNSMKISVDENFRPAAHQIMSADRSNVQIPPGYHGSTTAGLPTRPHGIDLPNAMNSQVINSLSQMVYTGYDHVLPSEPSYASTSSFQSSRTLALPEGNHKTENIQSIDSDDNWLQWLADDPLFDNGYVRGTGRGVIGWLKIKAVFKWGYFIRKRGGRLVELDQPLIEVQACS
ncbi:hypothetical protein EUGRSUZ_E01959 [Eucalyptus grandis]|uniref:Uncharacterized protein n=2 Tax=Eucalyptus grandis TaxID=71139 RepID=A0ACC3KWG9_EUCGR|nr:hypothetical protein EUGRSUZ_E01959 [Eucalyptus grandis]